MRTNETTAQKARRFYLDGFGCIAIGRVLGLRPGQVRSILKGMGVKVRGRKYKRFEHRGRRLCLRCQVILDEAPPGTEELCGWCVEEIRIARE